MRATGTGSPRASRSLTRMIDEGARGDLRVSTDSKRRVPEISHDRYDRAEEGTPMRRDTRTLVRAAFATLLGVLSVPLAGSIEARAQPADLPANVPPYNPYPSGILPAGLQS